MEQQMLLKKPAKVLLIGDVFVSIENLKIALGRLKIPVKEVKYFFWGPKSKDEFQKKAINIEKNGPEAEAYVQELDEEIKDADVIITHFCPMPRKLIEKGEKLKLIGTCRGGMEHIAVESASKRNIPVIHVVRNAEPVADFTLGLILGETRNIAKSHFAIKNGKWQKEYPNSQFTTTLRELTVGVIGLGNIGKLVANKLTAWGIKVLGYDDFVSTEELKQNRVSVEMASLERIFSEADVVSLHLRLSEKTQHIVNMDMLSKMKKTSYLINTSRSGLIDESALIKVLQEKQIAGAALDVFAQEPLLESPFMELDNVTLTPHIAGDTVDAIPKSPNLLAEEINNFIFAGKLIW